MTTTTLTEASPVEIDTALADLMYAGYSAAMMVEAAKTAVFYSADAKRKNVPASAKHYKIRCNHE